MGWLNDFLGWVWARHHNILSWYVRPLFILPFCYFAYKRNWMGLLITILLFPTTLFWFPAPVQPDPQVEAYLAWEQQLVGGENIALKIGLVLLVVLFLALLGAAFWKRNWLYGLAVLNAGTLLKVLVSVGFAGEEGWSTLIPSIVTLAICDTIILVAMRIWGSRRARIKQA